MCHHSKFILRDNASECASCGTIIPHQTVRIRDADNTRSFNWRLFELWFDRIYLTFGACCLIYHRDVVWYLACNILPVLAVAAYTLPFCFPKPPPWPYRRIRRNRWAP